MTTIKVKPKTIKIGHGYYDLKTMRELVDNLPDGELRILSKAGNIVKGTGYRRDSYKSPELAIEYNRGSCRLIARELPFYQVDNGKVKTTCSQRYGLKFDQNPANIPANTFSLLSVTLPMEVSKCQI